MTCPIRRSRSLFSGIKQVLPRVLSGALISAFSMISPQMAFAERVMIQALGKADFVNAHLGNSFRMGELAQMVLIYDTTAVDTSSDPKLGIYDMGAVVFFQISDEQGTPYTQFEGDVGGTITVTEGGASGDGFAVSSYSNARFKQDPDNHLRGPKKNDLPLLGAFLQLRNSKGDAFSSDALPNSFGDDTTWHETKDYGPRFDLQYCNSCGTGGGFGRAVSFLITEVEVENDLNSISFTPGAYGDGGKALFLNGEIDASSLKAFEKVQEAAPSTKTMVLNNIPGSADDDTNLKMSLKIHKGGYQTVVPSEGLIASGGVDLFLSGTTRILQKGACVGVHSWSGPGGQEGAALPRSDKEHAKYLQYFRDLGIQEAFYWFTLQAAPSGGMHWMTQAEATKYAIATSPVPQLGSKAVCDTR